MSVPEYLGWAKSLLESLGVMPFVLALLIIVLAITVVRRFFGDS